jgi:hypothetical protein
MEIKSIEFQKERKEENVVFYKNYNQNILSQTEITNLISKIQKVNDV